MKFEDMLLQIKILTVVIGTVQGLLAFEGYWNKNSKRMLSPSKGSAVISTGSVRGGILFKSFHSNLLDIHIIKWLIVAPGFLLLISSVYGRLNQRR